MPMSHRTRTTHTGTHGSLIRHVSFVKCGKRISGEIHGGLFFPFCHTQRESRYHIPVGQFLLTARRPSQALGLSPPRGAWFPIHLKTLRNDFARAPETRLVRWPIATFGETSRDVAQGAVEDDWPRVAMGQGLDF